MSTWSRSQWIEDAKKRVLQNTRRTDDYTRELIFLYDEAAVNIEKEIEAPITIVSIGPKRHEICYRK